jgi:inhibitor of cysteine peptidase
MIRLSVRPALAGASVLVLAASVVSAADPSSSPSSGTEPAFESLVTLQLDCEALESQPNTSTEARLIVGGQLRLELCSNPSTGFGWSEPIVAVPDVLELVETSEGPAASPMPGAPGTQTFAFDALAAGATTVDLSYDQPWEGGEKAAWTLHIDALVTAPAGSFDLDCDAFGTEPHQVIEAGLAVGEDLVVTVCSNASTGYGWSDPVIGDPAVLAPTGSIARPAPSPMPGAPGTQTFGFRAVGSGTTEVTMSYDQPWEGGDKGAWTLTARVTVS